MQNIWLLKFPLMLQLHSNAMLRTKTHSFDFDEMSTNSPPWPPVSSPRQNYEEDDKETALGEWVDKVMVNKQDVSKIDSPLGCWEANNGHLSKVLYHKYLQDSSEIYTEQSYNMFMGGNQFNLAGSDDMDDLDAATSASSEPDLPRQFNHSKLNNGIGLNTKTFDSKSTKSPQLR